MKLELVSFALCPYVQRSVVTLKYKQAEFTLTYIDLESPPEWFLQKSPLGQVPILIVDDKTVLFESAVINEFIDETVGAPLLSRDPLQRAFERAWIEYGSELLKSFGKTSWATDRSKMEEAREELFQDLQKLEAVVDPKGPYFRGNTFSLVDTAYAPMFMRLFLSDSLKNDSAWSRMPAVKAWGEALMKVPAVRESVVKDFDRLWIDYFSRHLRP